jgi:hypothetical protein
VVVIALNGILRERDSPDNQFSGTLAIEADDRIFALLCAMGGASQPTLPYSLAITFLKLPHFFRSVANFDALLREPLLSIPWHFLSRGLIIRSSAAFPRVEIAQNRLGIAHSSVDT